MYVSNRIQYRHLIWEALVPIVIATLWSLTVVYLHVFAGLNWVVLPVLPVTLVGIAVSLYVAFKSASAYNRWWEARTANRCWFDGGLESGTRGALAKLHTTGHGTARQKGRQKDSISAFGLDFLGRTYATARFAA